MAGCTSVSIVRATAGLWHGARSVAAFFDVHLTISESFQVNQIDNGGGAGVRARRARGLRPSRSGGVSMRAAGREHLVVRTEGNNCGVFCEDSWTELPGSDGAGLLIDVVAILHREPAGGMPDHGVNAVLPPMHL